MVLKTDELANDGCEVLWSVVLVDYRPADFKPTQQDLNRVFGAADFPPQGSTAYLVGNAPAFSLERHICQLFKVG